MAVHRWVQSHISIECLLSTMNQPSTPFPDLAEWQADAFEHRKHISSWCWEGGEGYPQVGPLPHQH